MANSCILRTTFKALSGFSLFVLIILLQGCIIYSKPAYSGRVIDVDDGTPIQGVRVEVDYYLGHQTIVEQSTYRLGWYQTTTDQDGYFEISPWTTLKSPFSWDDAVVFSFRKKGYVKISSLNLADCLSIGCERKNFELKSGKRIIISSHLIELSKDE